MARQNDYDFEVPGLDEEEQGGFEKDIENQEEVKSDISLFWLLQHYNKENAAAYKIQKARKKEQKKIVKQSKQEKKETKKAQEQEDVQTPPSVPRRGEQTYKGEEKYDDRGNEEEDDFGATVYVNRDSRPGTADVPFYPEYPKASLKCPGYGQTVPVDNIPFYIGRSASGVDLCIADNKTVGRIHAVISYHDGVFYIKDLNSLNHVYLNGTQIQPNQETKLNSDTKILLGNEELIFHFSSRL